MKKTLLLFIGFSMFTFTNQAQTVTDYDLNTYDTVHIGTQVWLKQNLKSLHYADGTLIDSSYVGSDNGAVYGRYYTWNSAMNHTKVEGAQGVCPSGWHVPSEDEWDALSIYLGGDAISGEKLKETGTTHWQTPNELNATNSSKFTALPGGIAITGGAMVVMAGQQARFWTSTPSTMTINNNIELKYNAKTYEKVGNEMTYATPIRCMEGLGYVGIKNIKEQEIKIYLNPANSIINISNSKQNTVVSIFDLSGRELIHKQINNQQEQIDISKLVSGIYIVKAGNLNEVITKKVVKK